MYKGAGQGGAGRQQLLSARALVGGRAPDGLFKDHCYSVEKRATLLCQNKGNSASKQHKGTVCDCIITSK